MNQQLFEDARNGFSERIVPSLPCNHEMSEWTPLHIACLLGKENFAEEFLQKNPEFLKLVNPYGYTALHLASSNGHSGIVDLLLRFRGPDDNQSVYREACPDYHHSVNKELCMKKDKDGRNPLHHAVVKEKVEVVKKLLQTCPESALELTDQKQTVFHLAVENKVSPSSQVFQALLEGPYASYLLNLADKEGNTLLHLAIIRRQTKIIKLLIAGEPNLDVNAVNSSGHTPLDVLAVDPMYRKDVKIERMIISAGGIRLNEGYEQRENMRSITSGLLVMASFTATASWQTAIFLQGGSFWSRETFPKANFTSISNSSTTAIQNPAGNTTFFLQFESDMKYFTYNSSLICVTVAFLFSLGLILLLLIPIPARFNYVKWLISTMITVLILAMFFGLYLTLLMTNFSTNGNVLLSVIPIFFISLAPAFGFVTLNAYHYVGK